MNSERINIGEFDTAVRLQRFTQTIGAQGQITETVAEYVDVWGKVERNVDEAVTNNNLEAGQSISLTCYKVKGATGIALDTRWKAVIASKTYEITGIDPISRISPFNIISLSAIDG